MVAISGKKSKTEQQQDANYGSDDDIEDVPQEVRLIAQEIDIVKNLACNDLNKRNKQLRKLRKWLRLRSRSSFKFTEDDFCRIWKGLYYMMWLSDKPLVQEDLCEQLGQLLLCFDGDFASSVNFFGAFVRTICVEWFGIDQWRIDKFMMLGRRMLRYMFRVLKNSGWDKEHVQLFNSHLEATVLSEETTALGFTMHILDIFFEELAKVSEGDIDAEQVGEFIRPFVGFLAVKRDAKLLSHCRTRVFYHLMYQSSLGREYQEKYDAWKEMGFPTASIDDIEKTATANHNETPENAEEGEEAAIKHLDPRAGDVDVFMPELIIDAQYVIAELEKFIYKRDTTTKCRKSLKKLLEMFKSYQNGEFPLGVKTMPHYESKSEKPLMKEKIENLENLENEVYGVGRKLKMMNKRKRKKLLKSVNLENVDESNLDDIIEKALPREYLRERQQKARHALMTGWLEEELDEPQPKKAKKAKPLKTEKRKAEEPVHKQKHKKTETLGEGEPQPKASKITETPTPKSEKKTIEKLKNTIPKASTVTNGLSQTPTAAKETAPWTEPLADGEVEYFIPSRKLQLKKANQNLVPNPLAKRLLGSPATPVPAGKAHSAFRTPNSTGKRVKIALKLNTAQKPSEYIQQIKSSPSLPYDANRKPGKGLLKPNSMPSPINPYYKKKIGLKALNDTI